MRIVGGIVWIAVVVAAACGSQTEAPSPTPAVAAPAPVSAAPTEGGPAYVGGYAIDKPATIAWMKENMLNGEREMTDAEIVQAVDTMAASMNLQIRADHTAVLTMNRPKSGLGHDEGTWRADGASIVVVTTDKTQLRCVLTGTQLVCSKDGGDDRMRMIWRREQ